MVPDREAREIGCSLVDRAQEMVWIPGVTLEMPATALSFDSPPPLLPTCPSR